MTGTAYPRVESLDQMHPDQRQAAVRLVSAEMGITYHITLDPTQLCIPNWNDCMGKSFRLQRSLSAIGVETLFGVWGFRWTDCALPPEVFAHLGEDHGMHMSLLYKWTDSEGEESLRVLDPTWYISLATGHPIECWDGEHGMSLTVLPTTLPKVLDPRVPEDMTYVADTSWVAEDLSLNGAFYLDLNRYCSERPWSS